MLPCLLWGSGATSQPAWHLTDASLPSPPPSPRDLLLSMSLGLLSSPLRTPFTEFRTRYNPGCSHLINYLHLQRPFPNLRLQMDMNLEKTLFNPMHNLKDIERKSFLNFYFFILGCAGSSLLCVGFSLAAASGGSSLLRCEGFSLWRLLLLWSKGLGLSSWRHQIRCPMAYAIFPNQGSNPCPLHQQTMFNLWPPGSPEDGFLKNHVWISSYSLCISFKNHVGEKEKLQYFNLGVL